jgi:glycerophosphoryl diester phosphodiesterase
MGDSGHTSGSVGLSRPLVVAHRGASLAFQENTLTAFDAAVKAGADMVELDVRLSADGVAIVSHDIDVSVETDGQGLVGELTSAELARFDVPTLIDALDLLAGRALVDIEVKNLPGERDFDSPKESVAHEVVRVVDELGMRDGVLVTSFNWLAIERVRDVAPDVETGFLTLPSIDPNAALVYARGRGHAFVLPHVYAVMDAGSAFVEQAHDDGVRVATWTVDDPERIAELFGWGVDAVITNDPATGVRVRDSIR